MLATGFLLLPLASQGSTTTWWDVDWRLRNEVTVTTGANTPDRGYIGYTARISGYNTATLIAAGKMQSDCDDLRILYWNGSAYTELARHVIGCNSTTTDIRFRLQAAIAASSSDNNYYIYYDNAAAAAPTALSTTNVYLWYDDASSDRRSSYVQGRGDDWHGTGTAPAFGYNGGGGYYTYNTGDNFTGTFRTLQTGAGVTQNERDVFVEARWYHTGCYPNNMSSGMIVRGISTGSPESSTHYYATNRAEFPTGCDGGGYGEDGDIVEDARTTVSVNGTNPGDVSANTWIRRGLAAWDVGTTTNLKWWDQQTSGSYNAVGFPVNADLQVSGTDTTSRNTTRGYAGVIVAQDAGRIDEVLIRRYVEPEPSAALGGEQAALPSITVTKTNSVASDPLGQSIYQVPGSVITYTIEVVNAGDGGTDEGTLVITDILPAGLVMCVASPCAAGDGIVFSDADNDSGLTYVYANDVRYTDESSPTYSFDIAPASLTPDAGGYSTAVTGFQIDFGTTTRLDPSDAGDDREFTLTYDVKIE